VPKKNPLLKIVAEVLSPEEMKEELKASNVTPSTWVLAVLMVDITDLSGEATIPAGTEIVVVPAEGVARTDNCAFHIAPDEWQAIAA
jgi:hypothetical protein